MSWEPIADFPHPSSDGAYASLDGKVYSLGAVPDGRATYEYNPLTDTWRQMVSAGVALSSQAAARSSTSIVVQNASPNLFRAFNPVSNSWSSSILSSNDTQQGQWVAADDAGLVYQGGGLSAAVRRLTGNSWTALRIGPGDQRNSRAALAGDRYIYVAGGGSPATNRMRRYNPRNDTWEDMAPLPKAVATAAVVAAGPWVWVLGGIDSSSNYSHSSFRYDTTLNTWTQFEDLPDGVYQVSAAYVSPHLYVWGGVNGSHSNVQTAFRIETGFDELAASLVSQSFFITSPLLKGKLAGESFFSGTSDEGLTPGISPYVYGVESDSFIPAGDTLVRLDDKEPPDGSSGFPGPETFPGSGLFPGEV